MHCLPAEQTCTYTSHSTTCDLANQAMAENPPGFWRTISANIILGHCRGALKVAGSGKKCSKCQLHQPQKPVLCYDNCLQHMVSLSKLLPIMGPSLPRVRELNACCVHHTTLIKWKCGTVLQASTQGHQWVHKLNFHLCFWACLCERHLEECTSPEDRLSWY
jgi:hypothetical protein